MLKTLFCRKTPVQRVEVPVVEADAAHGLTSQQVQQRIQGGWDNPPVQSPGKTVGQIIFSNIFTWFNFIFALLALCIIAVRKWLDLSFMGVVLSNTLIGIVQEIRSYKALEHLNLLAVPRATVLRDGREQEVDVAQLVRDDIVQFSAGHQICADAVVVTGECSVNEALITGEADEIRKVPGDTLLSGSFLVNGTCRARLTAVGCDSFVNRLTLEARKGKRAGRSEMMRDLSNLVKYIGMIIIPFGLIMFYKEHFVLGRPIDMAVPSTVGSLIGMIPEGLYLLTTLALVAGVVRLARRRTLVHEMECIETLARVDVLCVDKTGTITESAMAVQDTVPLPPYSEQEIRGLMVSYTAAMQPENDTMEALKRYYDGQPGLTPLDTLPFSSVRKYGGVAFADQILLLGAADVLLPLGKETIREQIADYSSKGYRVLLLARTHSTLEEEPRELEPLALILLTNRIREHAPDTFAFFDRQGVGIKVISGDSPLTVSEVARRARIQGAEAAVDARTLPEEQESLRPLMDRFTVFGRVVPEQKRQLVRALKAQGHTVAMTGDGVNDILALKEADCSIAMASGSEVATQVAHIVLMDNDFSVMPSIVAEGRRVINNIERSASLYLVKNIFTFLLAVVTLLFTLPYPLSPAQLSLVSTLTIGIPSFFLAMEPNNKRISGRFIRNVMIRALPAGLTDALLMVVLLVSYRSLGLNERTLATVSTGVLGVVGLMMVHVTCQPYTRLRRMVMAGVAVAFALLYTLLPQVFKLTRLDANGWRALALFALAAVPLFGGLQWLYQRGNKRRAANQSSASG
ncbi:MAG: HAD-IC family P-type ATPase [Clostridiales bacterium]|nr:HAD-IC family P-type ATPase [Clostridiales bacterium]